MLYQILSIKRFRFIVCDTKFFPNDIFCRILCSLEIDINFCVNFHAKHLVVMYVVDAILCSVIP